MSKHLEDFTTDQQTLLVSILETPRVVDIEVESSVEGGVRNDPGAVQYLRAVLRRWKHQDRFIYVHRYDLREFMIIRPNGFAFIGRGTLAEPEEGSRMTVDDVWKFL